MRAHRHRQSGAALLVMMLIVLAASTAILVNRLGNANLASAQTAKTVAALAAARAALIAYAATEPDRVPGAAVRLPCPDIDSTGGLADGEAHAASCGAAGVNVTGRLPWRTLGLDPKKDAGAACLWYAVSGDYKAASSASAELLNPDTAGQFRIYDADTGALIDGASPADRPVAVVFAPGESLGGQARGAADLTRCSATVDPAQFLDAAAATGIDNAVLAGTPDGIDDFALAAVAGPLHNDKAIVIRQSDLARLVNSRHDYDTTVRDLGLAVTACIAEYARNNSGGATDLRLPWPAPLALADYRNALVYDDANSTALAGRVPDRVDDSSAAIGNALGNVLSACDTAAVPAWTPEMQGRWQNWKDHFFYVVSPSFAPPATVPTSCVDCITVNSAGLNAAVVLFAGPALPGQTRTMPPNDPDTRQDVSNYLEGLNAAAYPYSAGALDLASALPSAGFNDRLFCIAPDLAVSEC